MYIYILKITYSNKFYIFFIFKNNLSNTLIFIKYYKTVFLFFNLKIIFKNKSYSITNYHFFIKIKIIKWCFKTPYLSILEQPSNEHQYQIVPSLKAEHHCRMQMQWTISKTPKVQRRLGDWTQSKYTCTYHSPLIMYANWATTMIHQDKLSISSQHSRRWTQRVAAGM